MVYNLHLAVCCVLLRRVDSGTGESYSSQLIPDSLTPSPPPQINLPCCNLSALSNMNVNWVFLGFLIPFSDSLLLFVQAHLPHVARKELAVANLSILCVTLHTAQPTHTLLSNPITWDSPNSDLLAYKNHFALIKSFLWLSFLCPRVNLV